jgi:hypothetical protein
VFEAEVVIPDNESVMSRQSSLSKITKIGQSTLRKKEIYMSLFNEKEDKGFVIREMKPFKVKFDLKEQ